MESNQKAGKLKRAVIYGRVSTKNQDAQNQTRELRKVARRHGWKITHEYIDHGISGAKGRDQRPEFNEMMKASVRKEFDVIMAWSVDRLGRSLQHLVGFLDEIHAKGVHLYFHQQGVDTTTPAGKALFQMSGVFAEFERTMIQERVRAGLERAKAQGKVLGRPKVQKAVERKILKARKQGKGILKIANEVGCGTGTVQRVVRNAAL
jgi:DNA invertase Pin-like site-specific DNA recombinase